MKSFADRIIAWQLRHGRHDLPWQAAPQPYRIWLSEIMLQQTQVATVIPYFDRFVARFPDVQTLAAAPLDDVMAVWAGLGYYSRARNLHRCAREIMERHGGSFPRSAEALAALPGIGRSTAAAIAVFAAGERAAILDGNVKRVLARHFGVDGYPGAAATQRRLWAIAESALPEDDIEAYTQGVMDLGATVCLPRRPRCDACPVRDTCVAARDARVDELPAPRPARARPLRAATVALIVDDAGAVLLERRAGHGIWGGLLTPPEFDADLDDEQLLASIRQRFALRGADVQHLAPLRHEFSHYSFLMQPRVVRLAAAAGMAEASAATWLPLDAVDDAALPAPARRLLRAIAERDTIT